MTKKVRFIPINACGLQVREGEGQEESRTVVGVPIVFGVRSVNLTPWSSYREVYEVMEPGCISAELLQKSDVVLNLNHSMLVTDILGRFRGTDKDTLKLTLNPKSVASACELPHTSNANDALELIKRGDITGMSFAFEDDYEDSENGVSYERMKAEDHDGKEVWVRHVKRVTALYDVSIVTHPAYEQTSVASREQGDEMLKTIDAQIEAAKKREEEAEAKKREEENAKKGEETQEGKSPNNDGEGETEEQKAEREKREAEAKAEEERKQREIVAEAIAKRNQVSLMGRDYEDSIL